MNEPEICCLCDELPCTCDVPMDLERQLVRPVTRQLQLEQGRNTFTPEQVIRAAFAFLAGLPASRLLPLLARLIARGAKDNA